MLVSNNLLLATMVGSVIVKYGLMPTVPLPNPWLAPTRTWRADSWMLGCHRST